jgi:hypothetical protein
MFLQPARIAANQKGTSPHGRRAGKLTASTRSTEMLTAVMREFEQAAMQCDT